MSYGPVESYKELLAEDRVASALDNFASRFERPDEVLDAFAGLDDSAALALLLAGPDACRVPLEKALGLLPKILPMVPAKLPNRYVLIAKVVASFIHIAECAGFSAPPVPIASWLDVLAAKSAELPNLCVPVALHAIGEGHFDLVKKLIGGRPPPEFDPYAPFNPAQREFLLELAAYAKAKQPSPKLIADYEAMLHDFPDVRKPLSFRASELFLIARIERVVLRNKEPSSIARELHEYARREAG